MEGIGLPTVSRPRAIVGHTGVMALQQPQGVIRRALKPPAIPDDVDDPTVEKAAGVITLPSRVRWSSPSRRYDLGDRAQRARVYEQVLVEGTAEDVRRFIEVDALIELWDELCLPDHVRRAWAAWLARNRGVQLSC